MFFCCLDVSNVLFLHKILKLCTEWTKFFYCIIWSYESCVTTFPSTNCFTRSKIVISSNSTANIILANSTTVATSEEAIIRRCSVTQACNFINIETLEQVFSCEFCEISKNAFSYRTTPVAASAIDSTAITATTIIQHYTITIQFAIFNPWKVPCNWIAFFQNSFVISPDSLYHLIRRDTGRLPNEAFTSNPIISSKQ